MLQKTPRDVAGSKAKRAKHKQPRAARDALVKAILHELEPLKPQYPPAIVAECVRHTLEELSAFTEVVINQAARDRAKAKRISKYTTRLLFELKELGRWQGSSGLVWTELAPVIASRETLDHMAQMTPDERKQELLQIADGVLAFLAVLRKVQQRCNVLLLPGRQDVLKRACASLAHTQFLGFSIKRPTSGSANSPYRLVASLIFEAISGQQGADLKRGCDVTLRECRNSEAARALARPRKRRLR